VFLVNSCQKYFRCAPHNGDFKYKYSKSPLWGEALFRSYGCFFAEFLGDLSLVRLGLLDLTTCVGLRYGFYNTNLRSFSRKRAHVTSPWRTKTSSRTCMLGIEARETDLPIPRLRYVHRNPMTGSHYYPSSLHRILQKYGNINPLSIDCDFRHCLRTRLTLGRSPLPRNP